MWQHPREGCGWVLWSLQPPSMAEVPQAHLSRLRGGSTLARARGWFPWALPSLCSRPCVCPVNLWKIYKAVEKLGAYELVSGGEGPGSHPLGLVPSW